MTRRRALCESAYNACQRQKIEPRESNYGTMVYGGRRTIPLRQLVMLKFS